MASKLTLRRVPDPDYVVTPNVELIRAHATRIVNHRLPKYVRDELRAGVKAGYLGHLSKDGLRPEIYFHPDHKNGAIEQQDREVAYAIDCICRVIVHPLASD